MCGGGGDTQVQEAGPYEKKLLELSEKRLKEYETLYKPFENRKIAEARQANSAGKKRTYTNDIAAGVKLKTAVPSAPPVGGGKLGLVEATQAGHKATGVAAAMGSQVAEDDYSNRMLQMVGLGRRQATNAITMTGAAGSREVATAIASQSADSYVNQAKYGMYGTLAGAVRLGRLMSTTGLVRTREEPRNVCRRRRRRQRHAGSYRSKTAGQSSAATGGRLPGSLYAH